jgi:hypothetical protein
VAQLARTKPSSVTAAAWESVWAKGDSVSTSDLVREWGGGKAVMCRL